MNIMSKLPLPELAQDIAFSFWVDGNSEEEYSVVAFAVEEAVFSLTRVEILLFSACGTLDLEGMLGRKAMLMVQDRQQDFPRYFTGLVVRATSSFEGTDGIIIRILLLPELYKLDNGCRYRTFQGVSVPDIVQTIFCEHGIDDAIWLLTANYSSRQFCMQYGESDFAFVQRILGEEGIFYYFAYGNEGDHQLVLCDKIQVLLDCPGQTRLDYDISPFGQGSDICCFSLMRGYHMGRGEASARLHTDLCGKANSPHLVSGHAVTLNRHPDEAMNGKWYLTSVRHEGIQLGGWFSGYDSDNGFFLNRQSWLNVLRSSFLPATLKSPGFLDRLAQYASFSGCDGREPGLLEMCDGTGYVCMFSALDYNGTYNIPQGVKPVVAGPQRAQVISVDAQIPRCKVFFTMTQNGQDRADDVTCWVNLASPLGALPLPTLPAEGENVIVDFLGGNPDQPIIIARGTGVDGGNGGAVCEDGCTRTENLYATGRNPLQAMMADLARSAVYQKAASVEGFFSEKPAISLSEMREAFSEEERNFKADKQMQERVRTSRVIDIGHHQRENIKGIYELNCGEKYLCRTTRLNIDALQKLTIRGPGGRVLIDGASVTLEAPIIRLRGRLVIEEEAFDRFDGIKAAIRDELPLVAQCPVNGHADDGKT